MEDSNKTGAVLSISDLWQVFCRCWYFMLAALLVVGGGVGAYLYGTHTDVYTATGSIWVLRETADQQTGTADVAIANNLLYDVVDTLRTNDVLEAVIEQTGSSRTPAELSAMLGTPTIPEGATTHIISFTVTSRDPAEAKTLAEAFVECTCEKINMDLFTNEVYTKKYDSVKLPASPSNPVRRSYILLAGIAAVVVVYLFFLLLHLLDGRIADERDLQQALGVPLLGDIPNRADSARHRRKYGGYYAYSSNTGKEDSQA